MCGLFGGGGGGKKNDETFYQNIANDQRINAERAQARAAAEKRARMDDYNSRLAAAFQNAPNVARNYASSIGVNPDAIGGDIMQIVNDLYSKAPRDLEGGVDPNSFFTTDQFASGFRDLEGRRRTKAQADVREAFAPGFENTLLPDADIDAIVDSILGEKQGLAQTALDFQGKRGLLTPQGQQAAMTGFAGQRDAAKSTLSGVARGELDRDRGSILNLVADAGNAASGWMLGMPEFNVDPYRSTVNDRVARERAGFGGDVRAALGNTELFDIPSLISQAGVAQGAQNLTTNDATLPVDRKRRNNTGRGLGTTGGF